MGLIVSRTNGSDTESTGDNGPVEIDDVIGLTGALADKAPVSHRHSVNDIDDLITGGVNCCTVILVEEAW